MPLKISRPNYREQLDRLTYRKGVAIRDDVESFLAENATHAFSADTLSARIPTAAAPAMIEHVLTEHDEFDYAMTNNTVYWLLEEE